VRPVIRAAVVSAHGFLVSRYFLVDTGADRTVLTHDFLDETGLPGIEPAIRLAGVGGAFPMVDVDAEFRLLQDTGHPVIIRNRCAASTDPDALDMSVLGRDITDFFALIVDWPGRTVCLVGQSHGYRITAT
jgi:hypothetical protein